METNGHLKNNISIAQNNVSLRNFSQASTLKAAEKNKKVNKTDKIEVFLRSFFIIFLVQTKYQNDKK